MRASNRQRIRGKFWATLAIALLAFLFFVLIVDLQPPEVCGTDLVPPPPATRVSLQRFAEEFGLDYPTAFANVTYFITQHGSLPDCYKTKHDARELGWSPGKNLWEYCRGCSIGGDLFYNREGRLPANEYIEADLDYAAEKRGAHRLVFVKDSIGKWEQWVTVDHYEAFKKVPVQ